MNNEITQEQYKAEALKQNTARRFAEYEDIIATLQTQVAFLQQQAKGNEESATSAPYPPQAATSPE